MPAEGRSATSVDVYPESGTRSKRATPYAFPLTRLEKAADNEDNEDRPHGDVGQPVHENLHLPTISPETVDYSIFGAGD